MLANTSVFSGETRPGAEVRRSYILRRLEVPVNERLWFHAVEVGHTLGTLKTPAHGMGSSVIREGLSSMKHWGQRSTVRTHTHTHILKYHAHFIFKPPSSIKTN